MLQRLQINTAKRGTALAMALGAIALAAPALAAEPNRTITGSPPTIAGERLSFSYAKARKLFGKPSSLGKVQMGCFAARDVKWRRLGLRITFAGRDLKPMPRNAKAIIADVTSARWSTPRGLRVGMDQSEVSARYPDAKDQGAGYWQLERKRLREGADVLQARTAGGEVTHLATIHGGC